MINLHYCLKDRMFDKKKKIMSFGGQRVLVFCALCLLGFCLAVANMQNGRTQMQPKQKSKVYLLRADKLRKDAAHPDAQVVVGNVVFRHDTVRIITTR